MPTLFKNVYPRRGGSQYYNYRVVVTENSQNVAGNTTNVTVAFSIKGPWDPSFYGFSTDTGIKIDGVTKKRDDGSQPYVADDFVSLLTWTGDVAHEANGQKTIAVAVWLYQGNSANYLPVSYTESSPLSMGSVALTPIPRNSEFGTINNFTIENAFTVPVIKFEPSFFDVLTIKYGGITIATREGYINGSVTLSASELTTAYNAMSAVISAPWTFELITYSDSTKTTQIGSTQTPVNAPTATISDTGRAPSWAASEITASDSNATTTALTGNPSIFIAGYSTLRVSLGSSANPNKGATLGSQAYKITSGSKAPQYVSQSAVFPQTLDFPAVINDQYTATVTDSRGSSTSYTKNIDLRAYSSPNITSFSVVRPDLAGSSAALKLTGVGTGFGSGVTTQNSITAAKYRYKELNGGTWSAYTNITLTGTITNFGYNNAINGSFDATKDYTFEVVISDRLAATTKTTILNSALVTMDIDVANRRVAIGKIFDGGANDSLVLDKPLAIANGGTGAATAADARANLELGDFALKNAPLNIPDGGTSATTAEGALIALGGISITKVWETSAPNANYVSGTINVNLSDYDLALVMFYGFPDQHHIVSTFVTIGGGMGVVYFDTTQMGGGTNASRRFVVNSTNIVFEKMWNSQIESSTGDALTPFRVYGIKGLQTI